MQVQNNATLLTTSLQGSIVIERTAPKFQERDLNILNELKLLVMVVEDRKHSLEILECI